MMTDGGPETPNFAVKSPPCVPLAPAATPGPRAGPPQELRHSTLAVPASTEAPNPHGERTSLSPQWLCAPKCHL